MRPFQNLLGTILFIYSKYVNVLRTLTFCKIACDTINNTKEQEKEGRAKETCWRRGQKRKEEVRAGIEVERECQEMKGWGIIPQFDKRRRLSGGELQNVLIGTCHTPLILAARTRLMSSVRDCHWNSSNSAPWQQECFLCGNRWGENNLF